MSEEFNIPIPNVPHIPDFSIIPCNVPEILEIPVFKEVCPIIQFDDQGNPYAIYPDEEKTC